MAEQSTILCTYTTHDVCNNEQGVSDSIPAYIRKGQLANRNDEGQHLHLLQDRLPLLPRNNLTPVSATVVETHTPLKPPRETGIQSTCCAQKEGAF